MSTDNFTLTVAVPSSTAAGTVLSNLATVSSASGDPSASNNSSLETTTVINPPTTPISNLEVTTTDSDGDLGNNSTTATTTVLGPTVPPVNQCVGDLTMEESTARTLTLTVDDDAKPAANLMVTASSSNTALLPNSALALDGTLDAPADLTASVSGDDVAVSWSAVEGASFYVLEPGHTPGSSNALSVPLTGTGIVIPDVQAGTYYARVRAVSSGGVMSAPSAEIVVTVPLKIRCAG